MMFEPSIVMINIRAFDLIRREPSREPSRKHPRAPPRARFSHSWFTLGSQSGSRELRNPPTSVFTMKVSQASCCSCWSMSYSPHTPLATFGGLRANSSSRPMRASVISLLSFSSYIYHHFLWTAFETASRRQERPVQRLKKFVHSYLRPNCPPSCPPKLAARWE